MALRFGALGSDAVSHGSAGSLDDLDPCTFLAWVRPTASTILRALFSKSGASHTPTLFNWGPFGNLRITWVSSGTGLNYVTNDAPLATLNTWYFVAFYVDTSAANHAGIYVGDLQAPAAESTYVSAINSTGTLTTNASNALLVGNVGSSSAWPGDIAWTSYWNRRLTLNEIRAQQFRPHVAAGCVLFSHYGFAGTGIVGDWSGSSNNGTITGATVADHVPLGPAFGMGLDRHSAPSGAFAARLAMYHRNRMSQ